MAKRRPKKTKPPEVPPPPAPKHVSPWVKRLKALRIDLNITQIQAAERCGVTPRTWIAWENSQTTPGRLALKLLQAAFPEHF